MSETTNKKRRRVTSFDVAQEAGVSRSTVAAVLNKSKNVIISKETAQRVHKAAERLGYLPKLAARTINLDRAYAIGLISCWDLNSPYLARPMKGIVNLLRTAGYSLTICDLDNANIESGVKVAVDYFRESRIDGVLIIVSTMFDDVSSPNILQPLRNDRVPFVLVNTGASHELNTDQINSDNFHAGHLATCHLLNHGHRRIAFIMRNPEKTHPAEEARYWGYIQALTEARISQTDRYVIYSTNTARSMEHGIVAFQNALSTWPEKPSAVYAIHDHLAAGVIYAAREAGLQVPKDLAVVGMDDLEAARTVYPPLTSLAQPLCQMGEKATQLLLQRIEETGPEHPVRLSLPCDIVIRKSCGCMN